MATSATDLRNLERFRYWQGQGLRSGDFRAQRATDEELRRLHNRALHDSGVRSGLTVHLVDAADYVIVRCGLAYDRIGRELLLQKDRQVPFPSNGEEEDTSVLVLRHQAQSDDERCSCEAPLPPDCAPPSLAESRVAVEWKAAQSLRPSDGAPLAAFRLLDGGWRQIPLREALDGAVPPRSRPIARPRLASGSTIPGQAVWEVWRWGRLHLGLQTRIDTSAAGFTQTPLYFAELTTDKSPALSGFFPPFYTTHITEATPDSFLLRVSQPFIPTPVIINEIEPGGGLIALSGDGVEAAHPGDTEVGLTLATSGDAPTSALISGVDAETGHLRLEAGEASLAEFPGGQFAVQSLLPFFLLWFPSYARQQDLKVAWLACGGSGPTGEDAEARCPGTRPAFTEPCGPGCGCGCSEKHEEDPCL